MPFSNSLSKLLFISFFVSLSACCHAQQMVQTPADAVIVCQQDARFIGKPLKDLLKEFKPDIKMVFAEGGWAEAAPRFSFFFTSKQAFGRYRQQNLLPIHIVVYLKETFKWDFKVRGKEHYLNWTKEDEENYGNLTIYAIRVEGVYATCLEEALLGSLTAAWLLPSLIC